MLGYPEHLQTVFRSLFFNNLTIEWVVSTNGIVRLLTISTLADACECDTILQI